jgi:hypothetical protein
VTCLHWISSNHSSKLQHNEFLLATTSTVSGRVQHCTAGAMWPVTGSLPQWKLLAESAQVLW